MTDYQLRQVIRMIYEILSARFEAGQSSKELLDAVAQLLKDPRIPKEADTEDD